MAVFVYAENINGVYKKAAFEAVSYAKAVADQAGDTVTAITVNPTDSSDLLYKYGASNVINIKDEGLKNFSAKWQTAMSSFSLTPQMPLQLLLCWQS